MIKYYFLSRTLIEVVFLPIFTNHIVLLDLLGCVR